MKNAIPKVSLAMGVLLTALFFTSCKKEKKQLQITPVIANNNDNSKIKKSIAKEEKVIIYRKPIVFIAGMDGKKSNFYKNARTHFLNKEYEVVDNTFSMEEILSWLNKNYNEKAYSEIHIVAKNNPWKGLDLETVIKGEKVTANSLRKSVINSALPKLEKGISSKTKVVFHSSGLGSNTELVNALKEVFLSKEAPSVVVSPYYSIFGGEFSEHSLAKPYYGFYPTAESPGNVDLSKEFTRKYPKEKDINWFDAITNEKEKFIGDVYSTKFNIPIQWSFDYKSSDEVPNFQTPKEIIDWIKKDDVLRGKIANYNIPVEKFRWTAVRKGSKLIIKGKTTVICVLKPLIKPYGDLQHVEPDVTNLRLYTLL